MTMVAPTDAPDRRRLLDELDRTLFVEAGWPRVPRDGFVRGGGLACANIRHLGIRAASEELVLAKTNNGTPNWKSLTKQRPGLQQSDIHHHISILLDRPR